MDFFASQDVARRNSKLLLVLFLLAVCGLAAMTNVLVFLLINFQDSYRLSTGDYFYNTQMFWAVTLGVVILVAIGSLFRVVSLRGGGATVAESLNGVLLVGGTEDFGKRRLLNIVEEMAIASSTPVPPVYVIPESSINAFAAGYAPGDAVIGVTQGAIDNLNRAELQGIVAHEFSHILNGDMRLNIRLMGVLYGILLLAVVGRILLGSSNSRSRSTGRSSGGLVAVGLGLFILGYLGKFFGSLIKAAVSRQREFLADAAAVQFTRNPDGIAGALKRIGGYHDGSIIENPESEELSHTFFAEGVKFSFAALLATHPPLDERIQRIEPRWSGKFQFSNSDDTQAEQHSVPLASGFSGRQVTINAEAVVGMIGNPGPGQLTAARSIIAAVPEVVRQSTSEPYLARAVIYLLLLDRNEEIRGLQLQHLAQEADVGVFTGLSEMLPHLVNITPEMRMPLLEMSIPTLRQLSRNQYHLFKQNIEALIKADSRMKLDEWVLQKIVLKHLDGAFEGTRSMPKFRAYTAVKDHCSVLLSTLAHADKLASVAVEDAFEMGCLVLDMEIPLLARSDIKLRSLNAAVDALARLYPLKKPKLLKACIAVVTADERVAPIEAQLMRAIAASLDCPMPPFEY
jgi:Zn-dependent protease with chaperone function